MLQVTDLDAWYGQLHVLKGVRLHVASEEVVVMLGPNGHGKSTFLKAICGLVARVEGRIAYKGEQITGLSPEKLVDQGVIYIAENRELFPEMTVLENLRLGAFARKARPFEKENLEKVFALFPRLAERRKQLAGTISGGEARMLAIGRGLMSNADFLCIDEPSLGLQPSLRMEIVEILREIRSQGKTLLVVEQNIPQITEIADRIHVLEEGRIRFSGGREDALQNDYLKEIFLGM